MQTFFGVKPLTAAEILRTSYDIFHCGEVLPGRPRTSDLVAQPLEAKDTCWTLRQGRT